MNENLNIKKKEIIFYNLKIVVIFKTTGTNWAKYRLIFGDPQLKLTEKTVNYR